MWHEQHQLASLVSVARALFHRSYPCTSYDDCHLPNMERKSSRIFSPLLCSEVDILCDRFVLIQMNCRQLLKGRDGRLPQAYPLIQQDILSRGVVLTWLGIESIQCEVSRANTHRVSVQEPTAWRRKFHTHKRTCPRPASLTSVTHTGTPLVFNLTTVIRSHVRFMYTPGI